MQTQGTPFMGKWEKVLEQILRGRSDANVPFEDLCGLLEHLGFTRRIRGSHHVFRKEGIAERPNIQRSGHLAKPYQVRQVRDIILRHKLGDDL